MEEERERAETLTDERERSKRITRWDWQALGEAKTKEEFMAVLAKVAADIGEQDLEVRVQIAPKEYLRLMGNAWLAHKYGEIPQLNIANVIDRALQLYDQYLKELALRRRREV